MIAPSCSTDCGWRHRAVVNRRPVTKLREAELGAEAVEFGLVAPILFLLIFWILYLLLLFSAQISLMHSLSRGLRYAVIPVAPAYDQYPTSSAVKSRLTESSPFFTPSDCSLVVTGAPVADAPVSLSASCDFPNPVAGALNSVSQVLDRSGGTVYPASVVLTAGAEGRRE